MIVGASVADGITVVGKGEMGAVDWTIWTYIGHICRVISKSLTKYWWGY
jgi:hypothetical protein